MNENPYLSPEENPPGGNEPTTSSGVPFPNYVPIVQLALRLLGVYIFAAGVSNLIQNFGDLVFWGSQIDDITAYLPNYGGAILGNVFYAGVGAYLMVGGRWLIETIFLPREFEQMGENVEDESEV